MTIRIIDLLVKIAMGKEVPKKIKVNDNIYHYDETDCNEFYRYRTMTNELLTDYANLNDEVEIIEEDKKIEKLDVALLGQCDNWLRCPTNKVTKQDIELNPYIIDTIRENTLGFQHKINEIIDAINELEKGDEK